ncbi:endonuclease [Lujinxingia litoralis]|uniref:Endonuclease n=1 Tax=Lujinxingia litoralis TaxID=2211119 RepID=A0A328C6V9_9DELT|nr:endonuclease/exonuclease/phosphatase family protein [Lujinxingia litoralis]RAL20254.1 endonuclease [Lujinxingia litoralis]
MSPRHLVPALAMALCACSSPSTSPDTDHLSDTGSDADVNADVDAQPDADEPTLSLRVATFNTSLFRSQAGGLIETLQDPDDEHPQNIANVIQLVRPDVLLLNEFDYDEEQRAIDLFVENFLEVDQANDGQAISYPYRYQVVSNTGLASGVDLDGNGQIADTPGTQAWGNDAFGFGTFPGQYAFAVLSKYPLDLENMRSFQTFLWADMPENRIPQDFYGEDALAVMRLSSKNHIDLPIEVEGHTLHLLASHPTPPAFDGPEGRNKRRNADEIRFWHDYIRPQHADYIYDDQGTTGGLPTGAHFVIVGDLNDDPVDGSGLDAVDLLLADELTHDPQPESTGAVASAEARQGANNEHQGEHRFDTARFNPNVGNLRLDYALPSSTLQVEGAGVFWPASTEDYSDLIHVSDHHLVWVDVTFPGDAN